MREAAETLLAISEDELRPTVLDELRREVLNLTAQLDELAERFGSDEAGRCGACGAALHETQLPGGEQLRYCTICPGPILDAARAISDLTGADFL